MKPLRAIIAEDEELMRHHLRVLIQGLQRPVEVVAEATDGGEAVRLIEEHQPDLIFLDVQMPVIDGFGVVEKLMLGGRVPEIIFTTAYDRYALRAFELNATHYLLKPVSAERLAAAVDRVGEPRQEPAPTEAREPSALLPDEESLRKLLQSFQESAPPRPTRRA